LHYFKNEDNDKKDITYQSTIMNTKYKLKLNHTKNGVIRNPWLDIWPIDTMPANKLAFFIRKYRILYKRFRYQASVFDNWADVSERRKRPIFEKILIFLVDKLGLGKKSNPKKMLDRLDKELKKNVKKPKYYMNGMSKYKFKNLMPIEVYGEGKEYEFEGLTLRGPVDYDYYLTRIYGDYMTPPPDSEKDRYSIEIIEDNTNE